jgi:hypothetical protein
MQDYWFNTKLMGGLLPIKYFFAFLTYMFALSCNVLLSVNLTDLMINGHTALNFFYRCNILHDSSVHSIVNFVSNFEIVCQ